MELGFVFLEGMTDSLAWWSLLVWDMFPSSSMLVSSLGIPAEVEG